MYKIYEYMNLIRNKINSKNIEQIKKVVLKIWK